ncbi:MAG TPA: aminoglycoside phosphotransferase family protein [Pyrinomonadaceae bacterium]|nr:aminoglycoside phosphotransferase family protein [Pyrinomonadaceae bacterium]
MQIPSGLRETIRRVHGPVGEQWLTALPTLLGVWRARWRLQLDEPFENLSYNLVIPGITLDGLSVVLKMGVPCRELLTEAAALRSFQGEGAVRLLDDDAERGALLLERITPGSPLYELQEGADAVRTAARLMRELWRTPPAEHSLPTIAVWFRAFERLRSRFGGGVGPLPPELISKAERTFTELEASSEGSVLLHGDLHHDNILFSDERGWVAIDPKGIVGDRGYEVGSFMLNQLPAGAAAVEVADIFSERLSIFAYELKMDGKRLARWAFCHAVLSALWSLEEGDEWQSTIRLAELLERLG